jgi:hypothetical protein
VTAVVESACYVFGIVPIDELPAPGGQQGGADTRVIRHRRLGAVIGTTPTGRALGTADDLLTHDRVLAAIAVSGTPVLPMRFGAVLTDEDAVVHELLEPHHDEFVTALERVRGCLQYSLTVRHEENAVIREVLADDPDLQRLRNRSQGSSQNAFDAKLKLGAAVVAALEARRPRDQDAVMAQIARHCDVRIGEPGSPEVVLQASFLVHEDDIEEFERSVEQVGASSSGRLKLRLAGPSPAYDFVGGD